MSQRIFKLGSLYGKRFIDRKVKKFGLPAERQIKEWHIVSGDTVQVIDGPEKGKIGQVLHVLRKHNKVCLMLLLVLVCILYGVFGCHSREVKVCLLWWVMLLWLNIAQYALRTSHTHTHVEISSFLHPQQWHVVIPRKHLDIRREKGYGERERERATLERREAPLSPPILTPPLSFFLCLRSTCLWSPSTFPPCHCHCHYYSSALVLLLLSVQVSLHYPGVMLCGVDISFCSMGLSFTISPFLPPLSFPLFSVHVAFPCVVLLCYPIFLSPSALTPHQYTTYTLFYPYDLPLTYPHPSHLHLPPFPPCCIACCQRCQCPYPHKENDPSPCGVLL